LYVAGPFPSAAVRYRSDYTRLGGKGLVSTTDQIEPFQSNKGILVP